MTTNKLVNGQVVLMSDADLSARAYDHDNPPPVPRYIVPLGVMHARLQLAEKWDAVMAVLNADGNEEAKARLMRLNEGIYFDDTEARALLTAAGADPDEILRKPEPGE